MTRAPAVASRTVYIGAATACSMATTGNPSRALAMATSIRPRQPEHVLGEVGEDEVGRDRRDLIEPRLAELALDVVLLGETEPAMGLQANIGSLPRRIGGQHLRHVALGAAVEPGVVAPRRLLDHQLRSEEHTSELQSLMRN